MGNYFPLPYKKIQGHLSKNINFRKKQNYISIYINYKKVNTLFLNFIKLVIIFFQHLFLFTQSIKNIFTISIETIF